MPPDSLTLKVTAAQPSSVGALGGRTTAQTLGRAAS